MTRLWRWGATHAAREYFNRLLEGIPKVREDQRPASIPAWATPQENPVNYEV